MCEVRLHRDGTPEQSGMKKESVSVVFEKASGGAPPDAWRMMSRIGDRSEEVQLFLRL